MKKFISIVLVFSMLISVFTIPASALYSWFDEDIKTVDEAVAEYERYYGEVETNRYYFLMPNGSNGKKGDESREYAQSWYKTYFDGTPATDTACIYWWDSGVADPEAWVGYLPSGRDENDSDVFYADVPQAATAIYWNNGIDGGTDPYEDIYYCAAQTCGILCEYYDPDESPNYPDGTDSFDNMIYVIDPDLCYTSDLSGMIEGYGEWYYYYGNGCYGFTEGGDESDCLRDDHYDYFGDHVIGDVVAPTKAPTQEPTQPALFDGANLNVRVEAGESVRLPFTPTKSGYYEIRSNSSADDPKCTLYDSNGYEMTYSDDYSGRNFFISYYLTKGKTYYYEISNYYNSDMLCPITFKYVSYPYVEPSEAPTEEPIIEPTEAPYYPEPEPTIAWTDPPYYPTEESYYPYPTEAVGETGVLNFDASTTDWNNYRKVFCHIWAYGGDAFYSWQSKIEACTDTDGDGVWTYDLADKGIHLDRNTQYCVIFSNENGLQTYDLLFDYTVLGDEAYCDGTYYENPEDSNKSAQAAFWRRHNRSQFGPVKQVTSIGNVVGTCIPESVTPFGMFTNFLTEALINARVYSGKTDQQLLDDTAYALGLTREGVEGAIMITGVSVSWSASRSYLSGGDGEVVRPTEAPDYPVDPPASPDQPDLPNYPMEYGNTLRFDVSSAEWYNYKQIYCHIWEYGGDSFYPWGSKAEKCTVSDGDRIWTYDLDAKGITLQRNKQYCVIFFADTGMQTYDLLFDYTVLGDVACCADDIRYEAPSDSNKRLQAAFWCNQDCDEFGPVMCITSVGNVVGTCVPESTTTFLMLVDFFNNNLYNARIYSGKTDQQIVDDLAAALGLNDSLVKQAISLSGETVYWSADGEPPFVPPTEPTEPPVPSLPKLPDDADRNKIFIDFGRYDDAISASFNGISGERLYDNVWEFDFTYSDPADTSILWLYASFSNGTALEPIALEINGSYFGYTYLMHIDQDWLEPPEDAYLYHWQYIDHYSKLLHGDVDLDGEVTIMDATEVQILVAKIRDYSCKFAQIASDVDGDGEMSIMDSTEVQLMVAGLK